MNTFQTISPVDSTVYLERHYANDQAIGEALLQAKNAQRSWRQTSVSERAKFCRKAVDYLVQNAEAIGKEISWQMGRPVQYTSAEITKGLQERATYMIEVAEQKLQPVQLPKKEGFRRYIERKPLGTVFVLAPWNYPFLTSVNAIIPALMAGNTVLLKHSDQTPLVAERYAEAFARAGLPEGVFQYLHLTHEQVATIIRQKQIDYVAFTGSVAGGHAVQRAMSERFIGAGLELGGKDPAYVRADAPLDFAIENLVDGAFFNSGQSCCGVERIYVQRTLYRDFVEGFVEKVKTFRLGNPLELETNLGPMVRSEAAAFAQRQIDQATGRGAEALIDPQLFPMHERGTPYMAPQVLIGVHHDMEIMREETFGPVVGIMPVNDDDEAVRLMNDSNYGLTASVWTQDLDAAVRIGDQLVTGTFYMNRCDYLDPALAWTGVKNSGRGCTLSTLGYEVLTRPKSFHLRIETN